MSGNSADSFSEDSEAEEEKEEVKEKTEVVVKKKGPGRPPRKKKPPAPSPAVSPPLANAHKRRNVPPKSGKFCHYLCLSAPAFLSMLQSLNCVTPLPRSPREARRAEASLVRSGACSGGDSPKEKPHGAARPREGRLRALP